MATAGGPEEIEDGMVCTLPYLAPLHFYLFKFLRGGGGQIKLRYSNGNQGNTHVFGIMTSAVFTPAMTPMDSKP